MATIKKAYVAIIDLLKANASLTVEEILPQAIELAQAKVGTGGGKVTTFHRDEEGTVVAIQCYYHKRWFDPRVIEFGLKASFASGYNSMTKDGQSKWNKQQAAAKKAEQSLLDLVVVGELNPTDIPAEKDAIAAEAKLITPLLDDDGVVAGYETLKELLAAE